MFLICDFSLQIMRKIWPFKWNLSNNAFVSLSEIKPMRVIIRTEAIFMTVIRMNPYCATVVCFYFNANFALLLDNYIWDVRNLIEEVWPKDRVSSFKEIGSAHWQTVWEIKTRPQSKNPAKTHLKLTSCSVRFENRNVEYLWSRIYKQNRSYMWKKVAWLWFNEGGNAIRGIWTCTLQYEYLKFRAVIACIHP